MFCSTEQGLRLAKLPKIEAADVKAFREAVEADCDVAQSRNPFLDVKISEDFEQPVICCQLIMEEIRVPKLVHPKLPWNIQLSLCRLPMLSKTRIHDLNSFYHLRSRIMCEPLKHSVPHLRLTC